MRLACVVGVGSPHGDDQFGWLVAGRIAAAVEQTGRPDVVVRQAGSPAQVLDWLSGADRLFIVDACRSNLPEEWVRLTWPAPEIVNLRGSGSHDYGLWQTLELASRLGSLPPECRLWCAAGEQFAPGQPVSPRLLAIVQRVADDVLRSLDSET